jgi:hypothetical protein
LIRTTLDMSGGSSSSKDERICRLDASQTDTAVRMAAIPKKSQGYAKASLVIRLTVFWRLVLTVFRCEATQIATAGGAQHTVAMAATICARYLTEGARNAALRSDRGAAVTYWLANCGEGSFTAAVPGRGILTVTTPG